MSEVWGGRETGEPSTTSEVLQNLAWVCMLGWRSFWSHPIGYNMLYVSIPIRENNQNNRFRGVSQGGKWEVMVQ